MNKIAVFALVLLSLAACAVKPDTVDLPPDIQATKFPATYPQATTPPPYVPPQTH